MPALPNVSKVIRLDYLFTLGSGVPALSRQFYHYGGTAPNVTDITVFADNAVAGYTGNCFLDLHDDYTFLGVEATDLSSPTSAQALSPVSIPGGGGGLSLPQDTCFVVAYEIARRYRGGHPRGYWPHGITDDLQDDRSWQAASVDRMVTNLVGLQSAILAGGWSGSGTISQVSVSYFHGFTVVTSPTTGRARNVPNLRGTPVQDAVLAYVGRPLLGSQRRRIGR